MIRQLVQLGMFDVDHGIANKTGSLTPGKRADIILGRTADIKHDAVANVMR